MNCIEQDSLSRRRSIYGLGKLSSAADHCVIDTVGDCLLHCPTAFNAQSARVAVLLGRFHRDFWQKVWEKMAENISGNNLKNAKIRNDGFAAAHGTILFFEDTKVLAAFKKKFSLYQKNMKSWFGQGNGILQYMVWQSLAENEIGASLQHYNELIADGLNEWLDLPKSWELVAQMPFGSIQKEPAAKEFLPLEERLRVFE